LVHYTNGQTLGIPVIDGENIADWWFDPQNPSAPKNVSTVWTGTNEASKAYGKSIRVFLMSWENPMPEIEVASISLISAEEFGAPFVLAITLDP